MNGNAFETCPSGLVTVTLYVPGFAVGGMSTEVVMDVEETTVQPGVGFVASKLTPDGEIDTRAPERKFVPVRLNGSLLSPMKRVGGLVESLTLVIVGAAAMASTDVAVE